MATFWANIPYGSIVSELDVFKNQITNHPSLVSRRKSRRKSLEGEYFTISGLLSLVRTSMETSSHRFPSSSDLHGMIPSNHPSLVSRRKSRRKSLEGEYFTISGLLSLVRTSMETSSHRFPSSSDLHGMIPSKLLSDS